MKFKFIKEVDSPTIGYQGTKVSTGDIVELNGDFIQKAIANPDYEAVQKPRGRPKKVKRVENQS